LKLLLTLDRWIMKLEEWVLSYSIILISVMIIGNVVGREIFGKGWFFAAEVSKFAVIMATFMGITYAARKGRHIRMSAFFDMAPRKLKKGLAIIIPALTAVLLFTLSIFAYDYLMKLYTSGKETTALEIPEYILMFYVPIGFFLGGLQFLRNMWINIKEEEIYISTDKIDFSEKPQGGKQEVVTESEMI
jgi:C4-dicarboxylate transporter DctQ subunit